MTSFLSNLKVFNIKIEVSWPIEVNAEHETWHVEYVGKLNGFQVPTGRK